MNEEVRQPSELGILIDSPLEDFKKAVSEYNVGTLNGLINTLTCVYDELNGRKEVVLSSGSISLDQKEIATKGLFAEMLKIEEKVTFLRERVKDLIPEVFDTKKHQ